MHKKILYLSQHGDILGGGEISLLELIKNLNRSRFEPIVVAPTTGELVKELEKLNIKTKIISMPNLRGLKNLLIPLTVLKLTGFAMRTHINLIHSNSAKCALYGGLTAKLLNIPHIWHVRIRNSEGLVDKILPSMSDKIVVVSKFVASRFNSAKKLTLIYNGVDTNKFRVEAYTREFRKELGIPNSTFLIGTVGQLLPYKGHKFLISSVKEVIDTNANVRLLIVGDERKEGYKKELQLLAERLGIKDYVVFLGFIQDIKKVLTSLDLFVFPSLEEHFGRSLIEAMACALPVIATDAGAVPEIIENNQSGILVPPMDSQAITKAIHYLMKNIAIAKKMGINARERVAAAFSLSKNVRLTEQVYDELLH